MCQWAETRQTWFLSKVHCKSLLHRPYLKTYPELYTADKWGCLMQKIKSLADAGNPTLFCRKPDGLKLANAENAHQEGHKFTPVMTIWDLCNKAHLAVRVQEDLIHQPHFLIDHVRAVQTFCDKGVRCQGSDRRPYPHWIRYRIKYNFLQLIFI